MPYPTNVMLVSASFKCFARQLLNTCENERLCSDRLIAKTHHMRPTTEKNKSPCSGNFISEFFFAVDLRDFRHTVAFCFLICSSGNLWSCIAKQWHVIAHDIVFAQLWLPFEFTVLFRFILKVHQLWLEMFSVSNSCWRDGGVWGPRALETIRIFHMNRFSIT